MKKVIFIIPFAVLIFLSCSLNEVSPKNLEGTWSLQSLIFIIDGKEYVTSKARLELANWTDVRWEFLSTGEFNKYFSKSKYKGTYTYDKSINQVTINDNSNPKENFIISKQSKNILHFNSIEVVDAQKNYSGNTQEASILFDTVFFLNDQLASNQLPYVKKVQMRYVFSK